MVEDDNNDVFDIDHRPIDQDRDALKDVLASARNYLLKSEPALLHLARMTSLVGSSEDEDFHSEEDLLGRVEEIKAYIRHHFPGVILENLSGCYAVTPDPSTLPQYQDYVGPWLARSIEQRKSMTLKISLNLVVVELLQTRSVHNRHIEFFLQLVVIHELAHVIMFTFSIQPTPTRYHGYNSLDRNARGIDIFEDMVRRGESGDSLEAVIVGGNVSLAIPDGRHFMGIEPEAVVVVVREPREKCRVIKSSTPELADIMEDWDLIPTLIQSQSYPPAGFHLVKMKFSEIDEASKRHDPPPGPPPSGPVNLLNYYMPFEPRTPPSHLRGAKP